MRENVFKEAGWPDVVAHTVIPAQRRPRQEELKFKASFQSIARPCISRQKRSVKAVKPEKYYI